eukprot:TRINITY_DN30159_c0_g1_i1.p1 TRINITY_DN30159_c0_g1~~TRINITY_DN30159_c0_g1_i1.p1  ORF type:complete len:143 (-),score=45.06 TRINITY_DN30159_c0_g1_i1:90-518(-)
MGMEKEIEQLRSSKSKLQQNLKESTIGYSTLQRLFEIEEKKNRESAKTIQELQSKQVQSKAAQIPLIASAVGVRKLQSPQNQDKPELFHSKTERQKLFFNPLDSLFSKKKKKKKKKKLRGECVINKKKKKTKKKSWQKRVRN